MTVPTIAHPPEPIEGWYASHHILRFAKHKPDAARIGRLAANASALSQQGPSTKRKPAKKVAAIPGWTCFVSLIGSTADLMVIHFRESLDALGSAEDAFARTELARATERLYSFLSVTEAGLYHITAELARAAEARGGEGWGAGDGGNLSRRVTGELASVQV